MKSKFTFLLIVSILTFSFASAQSYNYPSGCFGGMMSGSYGYGGGFIFGWIFMILIAVALVLLIIWLVKQLTQPMQNTRRRK